MESEQKHTHISQLRQGLVSGEWVVIAAGRGKRPHAFAGAPATASTPKETCPFEHFSETGMPPALAWFGSVAAVPNRFPAFAEGSCPVLFKEGPYSFMDGVGVHEVFVLKDHDRHIPDLSPEEMADVVRAYQARVCAAAGKECIVYVLVFHNHGRDAGASLAHPHSQLIALPIVPPAVARSMEGSRRYFNEHGVCAHCEMARYELAAQKRIIDENEAFIAYAPFASKSAFEVRIIPKIHQPYFEKLKDNEVNPFAQILQRSIARLKKGLNDPAYNFFIHTAPVAQSGSDYGHYHWHAEIMPKTSVWAGVEIGVGIEISTLAPEDAAEFLRAIEL